MTYVTADVLLRDRCHEGVQVSGRPLVRLQVGDDGSRQQKIHKIISVKFVGICQINFLNI